MTTIAAPTKRHRRRHAIGCQHRPECDAVATYCCTNTVMTCEAHKHDGPCCVRFGALR